MDGRLGRLPQESRDQNLIQGDENMGEGASIAPAMPIATEDTMPSDKPASKFLKLTIAAALLLLATAGIYGLAGSVDLSEALKPERLAAALDSFGSLAPLVLILCMAASVVIPPIPSLPLDLAAGAAFGPFFGALYAVIGAEIGAIVSFLIGRAVGRETMSRLLKADLVFCQKCTDHQLMGMVLFARLIPIFSFDVISYGAGLTNISLRTFALATLVGMTPPTFAFTYLGSSVVSAQWPLIALGVLMVGLFLASPKLLVRYRSSWWARLVLGPEPAPVLGLPAPGAASVGRGPAEACVGCGVSLA